MDPKKREQRKLEKAAANLAAQLQQAGVKLPEKVQKMNFKEAAREAQNKNIENPSLEAEAVLQFLQKPAKFILKLCKRTACGEPFGTNYHAVAYCSDNCRAKDLQSQNGIIWNPHKRPEDRWGGEPPLMIPPAAINAMVKLLGKSRKQSHLDAVQDIQNQSETQEIPKEPEVMSEPVVHPDNESDETPIARQAAASVVYSTQTPEVVPEHFEQSPEVEENDQLDAQSQEDNTETTSPQEQPETPIQPESDKADFVFDFE
jgi:hypothetical protein